jgi:hypothetical protein
MSCIKACYDCAVECDHCAVACLQEENVKMLARCIELDMYCADVCRMAAAFMARSDEYTKRVCSLCAEICEDCAKECAQHEHDHCKICAEACYRCAEECRKMAA